MWSHSPSTSSSMTRGREDSPSRLVLGVAAAEDRRSWPGRSGSSNVKRNAVSVRALADAARRRPARRRPRRRDAQPARRPGRVGVAVDHVVRRLLDGNSTGTTGRRRERSDVDLVSGSTSLEALATEQVLRPGRAPCPATARGRRAARTATTVIAAGAERSRSAPATPPLERRRAVHAPSTSGRRARRGACALRPKPAPPRHATDRRRGRGVGGRRSGQRLAAVPAELALRGVRCRARRAARRRRPGRSARPTPARSRRCGSGRRAGGRRHRRVGRWRRPPRRLARTAPTTAPARPGRRRRVGRRG